MKSLIIGNFGYVKNQLDGQTIKTRVFFSALSEKYNTKPSKVDVGGVNPIISIYKIIKKSYSASTIYFLPGFKQLLILSPILILYKVFFNKKIHYIVVGGWLNDLISKSRYVKMIVSKFDSVNVEVKSISMKLKENNINANVLTNFRLESPTQVENKIRSYDEKIKMVFFSRVMKEKGVFRAIDVICSLNNSHLDLASLDIYGPLSFNLESDLIEFNNRVESHDNITYRGALKPSEITRTLSDYDFLIFPTKYDGEGFPGCIVDAKFSGISVICTDWKYNCEIINTGVDGVVFSLSSFVKDTCDFIVNISNNEIVKFKNNSKLSSANYGKSAFSKWFELL